MLYVEPSLLGPRTIDDNLDANVVTCIQTKSFK